MRASLNVYLVDINLASTIPSILETDGGFHHCIRYIGWLEYDD